MSAIILAVMIAADREGVPLALGACLILAIGQLVISHLLGNLNESRVAEHETMALKAGDQRHQIEQLFGMTDMLQSAESHADAGEVLQACANQLLPDLGGGGRRAPRGSCA